MSVPAAGRTKGIQGSLLGMMLFVSSEVMFFGGLFAVWFARRAAASAWPPHGAELERAIPIALTILLVGSSVVVHRAVAASDAGDPARSARLLWLTMVMGLVFLAGQAYEYSTLGFGVADGTFGTIFYALTGFHGLHVMIGVVILGVGAAQVRRGRARRDRPGDLEAAALYWHFVDAVWLGVFLTVYIAG